MLMNCIEELNSGKMTEIDFTLYYPAHIYFFFNQTFCRIQLLSKSTVHYSVGMACLMQCVSCLRGEFGSCMGRRVSKFSTNLYVAALVL